MSEVVNDYSPSYRDSIKQNLTITAHAGALGTKPNTLSSLKKAVEFGVDIVEVDLTFRPDGTPVIIHCEKPGKRQGVLFDDVLSLVASYKEVQMNLDLKSYTNLPLCHQLLEKHNLMSRAFFTGVFERNVNDVRQNAPNIPYDLNASIALGIHNNERYLYDMVEKLKNLECIGLNPNFRTVDKKLVEILHQAGMKVSVWTVNNKTDMMKMIKLGVDNITTKRPDKLSAIISNLK